MDEQATETVDEAVSETVNGTTADRTATQTTEGMNQTTARLDFEIGRTELMTALAAVGKAVPSKAVLPALRHVLISAGGGEIQITGTDLDQTVKTVAKAVMNASGTILVDFKRLSEIAREMPPQTIRVRAMANHKVKVSAGQANFTINGLDPDEFPTIPKGSYEGAWRVGARQLSEAIGKVGFAASTEETRPILNGILIEMDGPAVTLVATNGHRMAVLKLPNGRPGAPVAETVSEGSTDTGEAGAKASTKTSMILPRGASATVKDLLKNDGDVEVGRGADSQWVAFRDGRGTEIIGRLIEGPYPDYGAVVPKDNDRTLRMSKTDLINSVKRMVVMASETTKRVRLGLRANMVTLRVSTPDLGEGADEAEATFEGEEMDVGFNGGYLLEVLRQIPGDDLTVSFKTPERAAIFRAADSKTDGESGAGEDYFVLVMPLRLID